MFKNNQHTNVLQSTSQEGLMIPRTISKLKTAILKYDIEMEEKGINGIEIICSIAGKVETTVLHWTTKSESRTPIDLDTFAKVCIMGMKDFSPIETFYKECKELHQKINEE